MKKTFALALFGLLLCNGLSLFAASISTDYDHSANFSQYKTYSWLKVQAGDSLWAERIQQDVDAQLAAKGWTKVDVQWECQHYGFPVYSRTTHLGDFL